MNILIIEDDAAIRQELKLLLENALYQVTVLTEFHHCGEPVYRTIRFQNPSELLPVDRSSEAFRSTGVASSEARNNRK